MSMLPVLDWIRLALRPGFHLGWNLFLAAVPLALALWLFRRTERRGWLWWPLLLVFIVFLPNAAYTLTDTVHFVEEIRDQPNLPIWSVIYVIIPKYAIFIFLGFQSHVISLLKVGGYLRWIGHNAWVVPAELGLNLLCAIGVYWGRYLRFNSWDIVTDPQKIADHVLNDLLDEMSLRTIAWYFCAITVAYYVVKMIDVALWEYWQRRRRPRLYPVLAPAESNRPSA